MQGEGSLKVSMVKAGFILMCMYTRYRDNRILFLVELIIEEKGRVGYSTRPFLISVKIIHLYLIFPLLRLNPASSALSAAPLIVVIR